MNKFIRLLLGRRKLKDYPLRCIQIGAGLMALFYILAVFALYIAPYSTYYHRAMTVYRGALEAAPACLVVGVCAAVICDLMYKQYGNNDQDKTDSL